MTRDEYAQFFRSVRMAKGWTQQQMADYLQQSGADVTSRFGISHLEDRGSQKHQTIEAYKALKREIDAEQHDAQLIAA